jgi:hypothetical protein
MGAAEGEGRQFAPAAARNRAPILEVLRRVLPDSGVVLEIASGSGEHLTFFAMQLPGSRFQPSDPDPEARRSIAAWTRACEVTNVRPPLSIDVSQENWAAGEGVLEVDAILNINMIHIAPWSACQGLMRGAGELLGEGAPLVLYGPYRRADRPTAPSNRVFDQSLRSRNPDWGLRELETVESCASEQGLALAEVVEMPANNLTLVFRRRA